MSRRFRLADPAGLILAAARVAGLLALTMTAPPCAAAIRQAPAGGTVKVEVVTVTLAGRTGTPVVVVKAVGSSRALPIYIGPFEANAIWQKLSGEASPRPLTHDLLKSVLDAQGVALERATVTREQEGTFYAELRFRQGWRSFTVDARPSDAIALAMRCGSDLHVARALLRSAASFDLAERPRPVQTEGLTLQEVTPALAASLDLRTGKGALVADVRPGRFAGTLARGDVLLDVGGKPVSGVVEALLRLNEVGARPVRVIVLRRGARVTLSVPAARR